MSWRQSVIPIIVLSVIASSPASSASAPACPSRTTIRPADACLASHPTRRIGATLITDEAGILDPVDLIIEPCIHKLCEICDDTTER
jgi:hypothetical protein